ncbi:integrase [Pseudoxanthomonas sp. JBR18]|uniref:site-specific integrase n=1 Tax=Pseudoxanthomonas sp. JBR18 TaxID=2969308 RepID=UPI0023050605|nr:integrase [Pseudoxanthomonas sp. JBR18]WCE02809.1 integrase [Pseudoxanthomonas sp. JBR18]
MARGRKRTRADNFPPHVDHLLVPKGIYWDASGSGRWFCIEMREGRPARKTVATRNARLSELHEIAEQRAGKDPKGTIGRVITAFEDSTEFRALATGTQKSYRTSAEHVRRIRMKGNLTMDQLHVDRTEPPMYQRLVELIAKGKPESKPGAGDDVPGQPSKANHLQRYLSRLFNWGRLHGECKTNPAEGVRQAKERRQKKMPALDAYLAVIHFAHERGQLKPHTVGSVSPYLAPLMEIALQCRLRGIEVLTLTDANATDEGIASNRRKGSFDNVTRWTPRLRASWQAALDLRKAVLAKPKNRSLVTPLRPEDRRIFLTESGNPLTKSGLDSAWQRLMAAAMDPDTGIIQPEQYFTLHGLKHRGITDTKGTKAVKRDAAGHKDPRTTDTYDHELQVVEPAATAGLYEG